MYRLSFTLGRAYECISTWCHVAGALVVQFVLILYCKVFLMVLNGRSPVYGPGSAPLCDFSAMCTPVQWSWAGSAGVQRPGAKMQR